MAHKDELKYSIYYPTGAGIGGNILIVGCMHTYCTKSGHNFYISRPKEEEWRTNVPDMKTRGDLKAKSRRINSMVKNICIPIILWHSIPTLLSKFRSQINCDYWKRFKILNHSSGYRLEASLGFVGDLIPEPRRALAADWGTRLPCRP